MEISGGTTGEFDRNSIILMGNAGASTGAMLSYGGSELQIDR